MSFICTLTAKSTCVACCIVWHGVTDVVARCHPVTQSLKRTSKAEMATQHCTRHPEATRPPVAPVAPPALPTPPPARPLPLTLSMRPSDTPRRPGIPSGDSPFRMKVVINPLGQRRAYPSRGGKLLHGRRGDRLWGATKVRQQGSALGRPDARHTGKR